MEKSGVADLSRTYAHQYTSDVCSTVILELNGLKTLAASEQDQCGQMT